MKTILGILSGILIGAVFIAPNVAAAPAIVQRKNGFGSSSLTITSTSAGHTLIAVTDSTSSPASVQTTGGSGTTFTKIGSCYHTVTPEFFCAWVVKSSNASNTAITCTTCGTMNAFWVWEISGTDTTNTIDKMVMCQYGSAGGALCLVPLAGGSGVISFHNGFDAEAIIMVGECSSNASSITATGITKTNNGFPNGNWAADGILSSITTVTATPDAGCSQTTASMILGIKGSGANQTCSGTADIGFFDYGTEVASGNPTATANITQLGDLVVVYTWCLTDCTVTSVTVGSQTATATSVIGNTGSTAGQPRLYYVLSTTAVGAQTVTMTTSGGGFTEAQVAYAEFIPSAGCPVTHDVDSALASGATGATITTPSITPSAAGEILFGFTTVFSHATSVGSPWTCYQFDGAGENVSCFTNNTVNAWAFVLNSSSGATANNVTQLSSNPWQALLTSFRTSSGAVTNCTMSLLGAGPC